MDCLFCWDMLFVVVIVDGDGDEGECAFYLVLVGIGDWDGKSTGMWQGMGVRSGMLFF